MSDDSKYESERLDSFLSAGSAAYLEGVYEDFLKNPNSTSQDWEQQFNELPSPQGEPRAEAVHSDIRQQFIQLAKQPKTATPTAGGDVTQERKQSHVMYLINAYRSHGHHHANLNPLPLGERQRIPDLEIGHHGLGHDDLSQQFFTNSFLGISDSTATFKEIYTALNGIYCGSIGIEYMHITNPSETEWIQQYMEPKRGNYQRSAEERKRTLELLIEAEGLEKYLGNKYVGQKRFSVEGGESVIPMLEQIVQRAGTSGIKEMVLGMAHRGRLNVLVNILGKSPETLFHEFEGQFEDETRSGDVKYHLGFSSDIKTPGGTIHLALGFNPSHLEIISPVVEGSVRARQDRRADHQGETVLPVVIHGDAAFAGQGVVMETFNMSQARGYRTGGTIHIVINNQVGFTTSNPLDARSTLYCTDVAKMVQAPIIHVNGDDPDAVIFATQLAYDFRKEFHKDVVIDLVCYRRHGHNESDEPAITQPLMYQIIRQHKTTLKLYADKLINEGVISADEFNQSLDAYRAKLDAGENVVDLENENLDREHTVDWTPFHNQGWTSPYETKVPMKKLKDLAERMLAVPEGFALQKQVVREWDGRKKMLAGEAPLFWGFAENLAYATLVDAGYGVRISGQDCGRGTFSHRHAVLHDYQSGDCYVPLQHISKEQANFTVIDSILSEEAVMAFEYGYATAEPNSLVIWEGQFGDFANGAQVVIDQFISSGYQKWGRLCGLALFLPHGYEGMGPEHSSARLERFMQLSAQYNIQVCIPSTPAQVYHMIRRQMLRPYRKPLVVMTPKSLLRNKLATSSLEELANGEFQLVIPEVDDIKPAKVDRLVMCSGKVYYDLRQQRRKQNLDNVAIVRVEQLYPFPKKTLMEQTNLYSKAKTVVWCQEEPENQGAWYSCRHNFTECLQTGQHLEYAGRTPSAAPAVGNSKVHVAEQAALVNQALGLKEG